MTDSNIFFRGKIKEDDKFFIVGKLPSSQIPTFITNFPTLNGLCALADKYFFLCQNQYTVDNTEYQRLYWSCDPTDLQQNYNYDTLNIGAVEITRQFQDGLTNLAYYTTLTEENFTIPEPGILNSVDKDFSKLTYKKKTKTFFNFGLKDNFNVDTNFLYYGLPYNIDLVNTNPQSTKNNTPWNFRNVPNTSTTIEQTNHGTNEITTKILKSEDSIDFLDFQFTSSSSKMQPAAFEYIGVSGVSGCILQNNKLIIDSETYLGTSSQFNSFVNSEGVIRFENMTSGTSTIFRYHNMSVNPGSSLIFNIEETGLKGTTASVTSVITDEIKLEANVRNSESLFTNLDVQYNLSEYMDFYFVPTKNSSYFSGGHRLMNQNVFPINHNPGNKCVYSPQSPIVRFYNPYQYLTATNEPVNPGGDIDSYKLHNYQNIINFCAYHILGALNTSFWKDTGYVKYPLVGKNTYDPNNPNSYDPTDKTTIFVWSTMRESISRFMYDYCLSTETCGYCFGNPDVKGGRCEVDPLTLNTLLNNSSSKIQNLPPLDINIRANGSKNQGNQVHSDKTLVIGLIIGLGVSVILLIIVFVQYEKLKKLFKGNKPSHRKEED